MDLIDQIRAHAKNIPQITKQIATEEGTKNALIMPFIQILGYNVFDPNEVTPEFNADVGTKKGEKVDYALLRDGAPILLFECKAFNVDLAKEHASQLYRYFSVTPAKIGVLTNGILYQFFTDLDKPNTMDKKPFLEINLLDIKEPAIIELKKFTKTGFNIDDLEDVAAELKYTNEIKQILVKELNKPSDEFIRFFATQVYPRKFTQQAKDRFSGITKNALNQFINDRINDRLKTAMAEESEKKESPPTPPEETTETRDEIVTTQDEIDAFNIIRAISSEFVDPSRIFMRDAKSYCAILFDDNNRKQIARLVFGPKQKTIVFFHKDTKEEIKFPIENITEIFKYRNNIKDTISKFTS